MFYSSKCASCTESSKQVCETMKCRDEKGFYSVQMYECRNLGCEVCYKCSRSTKRSFEGQDTFRKRSSKG